MTSASIDGRAVGAEALVQSQRLRGIAEGAARSVQKQLRAAFRGEMSVDHKRDARDVVTVHDKQAEKTISAYIFEHEPDSRLLGEEGGAVGDGSVAWFVDPIDGTSNFVDGIAFWCVSVAAAVEGEVVAAAILDPMADDLFSADLGGAWLNGEVLRSVAAPTEAEATLITGYPNARQLSAHGGVALTDFAELVLAFRALRRPGSAALTLAHVAAGWADAAAGFNVNPWDISAAELIVTQAGGTYLPLAVGQRERPEHSYDHRGYVAIAGGGSYPTLMSIARDIAARS
ncbi:inositol monophosphatase family protein [Microbacterium sp. ARD32]|uniref:inositol monophosphatase family protein n=1 Tax=Microbacterium sp. ARD32 TaxID=2962577 RepID=UPI002882642E|nr:inositol monophosphatase family protein [Microbacterium sp. ARD32]MDT0158144.1 inositol monophosphatase family protein [Microbacterium sp. ARD32]